MRLRELLVESEIAGSNQQAYPGFQRQIQGKRSYLGAGRPIHLCCFVTRTDYGFDGQRITEDI